MAMEAAELQPDETEIVDSPCPGFDMSIIEDWDTDKLLRAILAELVMMRGTLNDLGSGLAEIGKGGLGAMFKGMFTS